MRWPLQINVKKTEKVIIDPRSVGDRGAVVVYGKIVNRLLLISILGSTSAASLNGTHTCQVFSQMSISACIFYGD